MIKIAHISDIHIRNFKRHDEYRQSFENLYDSLREKEPDFIVLTGDIAHTKTQISPEFVRLCAEFLENLSSIAPLHMIPGNHDANISSTRLDALTPIVEALDDPNIYYYKKSGIYCHTINGIFVEFFVYSCLDKDWSESFVIENCGFAEPDIEKIRIGLYHGFVQNAELQNGLVVNDCQHKVQNFLKTVDYLMLGDIHKHQILDGDYRAAYAGSLIQQNYGEASTYRGYLLWDIENKDKHTVDLVTLPNVCPFYTLSLEDDDIPTIPANLNFQKNSRIRVFSRQLTVSERSLIKEKIDDLYDPYELKFLDDSSGHRQEVHIKSVDAKVENLGEIGIQEKLIRDFLSEDNVSEDVLNKIFDINRRYDVHFRKEDESIRNIQYRLGKMTWSNIFSFGENNVFDFSDYKGLVGIFGDNGAGKSTTVVDVPLYCLFNKVSKKVTKNDLIINEDKEECSAEIEILLNNKVYNIERKTDVYLKSGKRKGVPVYQGRTVVDFNVLHEDGSLENRNGLERGDTDVEIRKVFGSAEDFMATSMSPQFGLLNFINLGGTERQKLIGRYFDIDIFDKKHKLAKEEFREVKSRLKVFEEKNLNEHIKVAEETLIDLKESIDKNLTSQEHRKSARKLLSKKLDGLRNQIVNVQAVTSPGLLSSEIMKSKVKVIDKKNEIENLESSLKQSEKKIQDLSLSIEKKKDLKEKRERFEKIRVECEEIHRGKKRIDDLKKYSCIKNADCCMLKEIQKIEKDIKTVESENDFKFDSLISTQEVCRLIADIDEELEHSDNLLADRIREESSLIYQKDRIKSEKAFFVELVKSVKNLEEKQSIIKANEKQLKKNAEIEKEIKNVEENSDKLEMLILDSNTEYAHLLADFKISQSSLEDAKKEKIEYDTLQSDYEAYNYFIQTTSKDGISKIIIADNLNVINSEIKNILSHGINFDIQLEPSENGKEIEIFFKHERSPKRLIELCSGMEKTIAAVAIRAALVSVTTLPKSNVYILDEVFSALNSEYLTAFISVLEYLKQLFESVIIITHREYPFRDIVDYVVVLERDNQGFSRVCV